MPVSLIAAPAADGLRKAQRQRLARADIAAGYARLRRARWPRARLDDADDARFLYGELRRAPGCFCAPNTDYSHFPGATSALTRGDRLAGVGFSALDAGGARSVFNLARQK